MIETRSETWKIIAAIAEQELAAARDVLERPSTSPEKTIALRAEITVLKRLLALPEDIAHGRRKLPD